MAGNNSVVFTPPMNRVTDNDPMVVRVPQDRTDWGFRKSQAPPQVNNLSVANMNNGK